jgi:tRNA (guanine10-N2)-dimethyltransferase
MGKHMELNGAQVVENDILEKGFELVLLGKKEGKSVVGKTVAIQNYEEFAHRDFEKPAADPEMGMLPPKLARIMVNLTKTSYKDTIWDPFCGSGAILLEALLLGRNALGSDIDKEAVANSEKNLQWLIDNYQLSPDLQYNVFQMDVKNVKKKTKTMLDNTEIKGVACEPYMGPPQKRILNPDKAEKLTETVAKQYQALFYLLEYVGSKGLRVAAVVPSYKTTKGWISVSMNSILSNRWKFLNSEYKGDLHWVRKTSIIKRNIMIFELD